MPINRIQDSDLAKAINNCIACSRSCLETFHYCVTQKGTAFSGELLSLLQYCSDACQLSAELMIGDSEFHHQSCELCFELCKSTAVECERYSDDRIFNNCAKVCRDCEESCRAMAGMTVRMQPQAGERIQTARI